MPATIEKNMNLLVQGLQAELVALTPGSGVIDTQSRAEHDQ
jgi:hypothetical protein